MTLRTLRLSERLPRALALMAPVLVSMSWLVHAQGSEVNVPAGAAASPAAAQAPAADLPAAPALEDDSTLAPAPDAARALTSRSIEDVRAQLRAAEAERANASTWLPWMIMAVGGGSAAVAGIVGTIQIATCHSDCGTLNWVAFTAVAGTSLATLAGIWALRAEAGVRALDTRKYQLELELERIRLSRLTRDVAPAQGGSILNLHFAL